MNDNDIKEELVDLKRLVGEVITGQASLQATLKERCKAREKSIVELQCEVRGNGTPGYKQRIHDLEMFKKQHDNSLAFTRPILQKLIIAMLLGLFGLAIAAINHVQMERLRQIVLKPTAIDSTE